MKGRKKVMVVEDDKDINRLISYNLVKAGFNVEQSFDGIDAWNRLKAKKFDIVVLDIMLPSLDGFSICKSIKENSDVLPPFVVVVSAKSSAQDKLYANILGADCYLTKPFEVKKLMNIIEEFNYLKNREFQVEKPGH